MFASTPAAPDRSDPRPGIAGESVEPPAPRRRVLLATDGSAAARAASAVAAALVNEQGAALQALTVLHPVPYPVAPIDAGLVYIPQQDWETERAEQRLREIRRQFAEVATGGERWPLSLQIGDPAEVISENALRASADLVVMGLRRHARVDRILRDETTLRVMRHSGTPVLAVVEGLARRPQRAVVAIDFSRASLRAARLALELTAPGGRLFLTYVQTDSPPVGEDFEGSSVIHTQGVTAAFARVVRDLAPSAGIEVQTVVLAGVPSSELLAFADRTDADLIAVGSHRHSLLDRVLLGSVTTSIARDARCSLLVVPPQRSGRPRP